MHVSSHMHMNMIISEPTIKIINKCNINIAVYQTTSHGDFMYVCVLGLLFANTAGVKIVIKRMQC